MQLGTSDSLESKFQALEGGDVEDELAALKKARWAAGAGPRPSSCPRAAHTVRPLTAHRASHRVYGAMTVPSCPRVAMMHPVLCSKLDWTSEAVFFHNCVKWCNSSLSLGLSLGAWCQPYQSEGWVQERQSIAAVYQKVHCHVQGCN